ncbi:hypothetical protein GQ457_10G012540 [Hibiscus cannabinus]
MCYKFKALNLSSLSYNANLASERDCNDVINGKGKEVTCVNIGGNDGNTKLFPYDGDFGIIDHSKELILQVLSGKTQRNTPNLYDVVCVQLASNDNHVVSEIYILHRYHLAMRSFYAVPSYDTSLYIDGLVDETSRQRQRAAKNEHDLIGVRETFLPLEKQFQTMERLFERLVAKTTLLEGEKKHKRGEHIGLVALLDKKEAQIWVMNEQHKLMTLIAFLNCKSYLKKAELRLNEAVGVEVMKIGTNIELLEGMSRGQSTFKSSSQNLLEAVVTTVCYNNKDIKEKPPDSIDDKEGEPILHITHDMDSHLLLQFTNVLLEGIFVICGLVNEITNDKEVEIVVVACVSLQLSHLLENAMVE